MAGTLLYFVVASIFAVAASLPEGRNEGGNGGIHGIFINGTTTNVSRLSAGGEEIRGHGDFQRIQIGNITTVTNSTRPGKDYTYCPLFWGNDNRLYWTTPDFGIQDYPNNADCGLYGSSWPIMAEFTFQPLDLQKKKKKKCVDYFQFTFPYGVTKRWCGKKKVKKIRIPTYNFEAKFISDSSITRPGFSMSINFIYDSPCHTSVYLYSVGDWGEFSTPYYPSLDTDKRRMCELIVYTQWDYSVQLDFLDFDLNPPCEKNNVVVNMQNEWNYPQATSSRYCGNSLPPSSVSTWNEVHLVYQANKRNRGFKVRYTAVYNGYYTTTPYYTTSPYQWSSWPYLRGE